MKKILFIFLGFFININSIERQPVELQNIYDIRQECSECSDYFNDEQAINNLNRTLDFIIFDIDKWLKSSAPSILQSYKINKASQILLKIRSALNEIVAYKSQRLGGVSINQPLIDIKSSIPNIDPILPVYLRFSKNDFESLVLKLIATYDHRNSVSINDFVYDNWIKKINLIS